MRNEVTSRSARNELSLATPHGMVASVDGSAEERIALSASSGADDVGEKRGLSLLASLLLALAPFETAAAQEAAPADDRSVGVAERTHADYQPLGAHLGAFDLNASVEFGAEHSNNLFGDVSGQEREDTYFVVTPSAQLTSHWSRHSVHLEAGGAFNDHQDFSSENANSGYVGGGGRLDIGSRGHAGLDLRAAHQVESRTSPDAAVTLD